MKKSKVLLLMLCTVALSMAAAFGTLAYLTDSQAVTNTFTVGQVHITLDELDVDNSTPGENDRDTANKYHLIPGQTYTKDPTIHVDADSEDCYLFVKVENGIADIETMVESEKVVVQMKELGWLPVDGVTDLYVFAKGGSKYAISKGGNVEVFKTFTIDGDRVDNNLIAQYKDAKIIVTAYAVQKAGFETSTPKDIWDATFGK